MPPRPPPRVAQTTGDGSTDGREDDGRRTHARAGGRTSDGRTDGWETMRTDRRTDVHTDIRQTDGRMAVRTNDRRATDGWRSLTHTSHILRTITYNLMPNLEDGIQYSMLQGGGGAHLRESFYIDTVNLVNTWVVFIGNTEFSDNVFVPATRRRPCDSKAPSTPFQLETQRARLIGPARLEASMEEKVLSN